MGVNYEKVSHVIPAGEAFAAGVQSAGILPAPTAPPPPTAAPVSARSRTLLA